MTDHLVKIGDTTLIVSTHRFCDLNEAEGGPDASGKHYVTIRGEAVSVVPEK